LGCAFKPGCDDISASPALALAAELHQLGAYVTCHDPAAMPAAARQHPELTYAPTPAAAVERADLVLHLTDWPDYASSTRPNSSAWSANPISSTAAPPSITTHGKPPDGRTAPLAEDPTQPGSGTRWSAGRRRAANTRPLRQAKPTPMTATWPTAPARRVGDPASTARIFIHNLPQSAPAAAPVRQARFNELSRAVGEDLRDE